MKNSTSGVGSDRMSIEAMQYIQGQGESEMRQLLMLIDRILVHCSSVKDAQEKELKKPPSIFTNRTIQHSGQKTQAQTKKSMSIM